MTNAKHYVKDMTCAPGMFWLQDWKYEGPENKERSLDPFTTLCKIASQVSWKAPKLHV